MPRKNEITVMAEAIIATHDGQAYFNFEESSKIVGCGRHTLARGLLDAGILVKRVGPSKRISAYDLAEFMSLGKVTPIDSAPSGY